MTNRNSFAGSNIETLYCNSVGDHPSVVEAIKDKFGIDTRYIKSIRTGRQGEKCDVKMNFADGYNVDVNIKGYKPEAMFNQALRTSLSRFGELHELDLSDMRRLFQLKAQATNRPLIPLSERPYWCDKLAPKAKEIVKHAISDTPSREILVLYDRTDSVMRAYKTSEFLKQLDYGIDFTPRGNIKIGCCFQLQRKGGDGNIKTYPKTDSRHPSNDIQVKIDIRSFLGAIEPFSSYHI